MFNPCQSVAECFLHPREAAHVGFHAIKPLFEHFFRASDVAFSEAKARLLHHLFCFNNFLGAALFKFQDIVIARRLVSERFVRLLDQVKTFSCEIAKVWNAD